VNLTGPIALGAGTALITAATLRGRKLKDVVSSGVSLAVASVPEGLPLISTAAQLAAAQRLSVRGALVRNARNIEALGRVDVLCVDKTGTVTEGQIELRSISDGTNHERVGALTGGRSAVLAAALRASKLNEPGGGDPMDAALARSADRIGVKPTDGAEGWVAASEVAFEAGRGYHAVLGRADKITWFSRG
jgi:cation-transporting ATPase I